MTNFEKNMAIAIAVSTIVMILNIYFVSTGAMDAIYSDLAGLPGTR